MKSIFIFLVLSVSVYCHNNYTEEPDTIKFYRAIIENNPENIESRYALFMIAFLYEDFIKDKEKAIESYTIFLERYPEDIPGELEMSKSARRTLEMLKEHRTIKDIIEEQNGK